MNKKPELLSPVGDLTSLKAAVQSDCDAVYFGVKGLNMRAAAKNFELSELKKVVRECHENDVKAYLCVNTIVYDKELKKVKKVFKKAKEASVDAIIAWDMAVLKEADKLGLPLHISTQASVSNYETLKFYADNFKVERIILARELSLEQIKGIVDKIRDDKLDVEVETFIHGAMCVSVSGRCFMSQFTFGKSANRGECLQNCRKEYLIKDIDKEFELKLDNNYVMSAKDLCVMPFIEKLIEAGIRSFKIEGRNRAPEYVETVTQAYREVIDFYFENKNKDSFEEKFNVLKEEKIEELKKVYNKGFSSGFFMGKPINEWSNSYGSKAKEKKEYVGKVRNYFKEVRVAEIKVEAGSLEQGDEIMVQGNKTGVVREKVNSMEINHEKVEKVEKGQSVGVKMSEIVRKNDKVYKIIKK